MTTENLGPEEYLLYEIIHQSDLKGAKVHKTELHKLAYLVYKDIEEEPVENQELDLPSYWYEHGIMVDFDEVITQFFDFDFVSYQSTKGRVARLEEEVSEEDFNVGPDLGKKIKQRVKAYIDEFGQMYGVEQVKDETYDRFGDEIVQELNDFRYLLDDIEGLDIVDKDEYAPTNVSYGDFVDTQESLQPVDFDEIDDQPLLNSLNSLISTFPEEDYNRMSEEFYEWESITRQLIYNNMYSQLEQFTNEFWNTFSQVILRVKHNENIPLSKIRHWKRAREDALADFDKEIERYRSVLMDNRSDTNVLNSVSEEVDQAVDETFKEFRNESH